MKKTVLSIMLIIIVGVATYFGYQYWTSRTEDLESAELYRLLLISDEGMEAWPLSTEGYEKLSSKKYIPESVLEALGFLVSHDEEENITSLASYDTLMRYDMNSNTLTYDGEESSIKNPPLLLKGERYFAEEDFKGAANVGWYINEQRKILMALDNASDYSKASLVQSTEFYDVIPDGADGESDGLFKLKSNASVFVGQSQEGFTEIITDQLLHGYIETSALGSIKKYETILEAKHQFDYTDQSVNLTWEAVYSRNPNVDNIPEMKGLNVISPTWMSLENSEGEINKKLISSKYVQWAHNRGYEIWPLVSNDFKPERTSEFLRSARARDAFIKDVLDSSLKYDFDGINIDFENVFLEDKDALSQFVAELSQTLRQHGITVSMDVTVIGGSDNWSRCYDRAILGRHVDYLMIMAYDQYWAASPISGPVAAYDWVHSKMDEIIEIVPAHKVVLGMPTYMRIWREVPSTEKANTMKAKSETLSMNRLAKLMDEKDFNFIWDEAGQHYYIGYIEENVLTKIWVEDGKSIRAKTAYARDNNLAGVATWRRGFETQDIWGIIDEELKK